MSNPPEPRATRPPRHYADATAVDAPFMPARPTKNNGVVFWVGRLSYLFSFAKTFSLFVVRSFIFFSPTPPPLLGKRLSSGAATAFLSSSPL
jgi:hypothetical protein